MKSKEDEERNAFWEENRCKGECEFPYCNSACHLADEALKYYDKEVHNENVKKAEEFGDFRLEYQD